MIISIEGVHKRYAPDNVVAVDGFSLDVEEGEILTLLGPSGCGKTTMLRLIAGLEVPDEGSITIGGQVVVGGRSWVPPERRGVGMVFQDYALFPHLTVGQNVAFGLTDMPRSRRRERAQEVLHSLGLPQHYDRYPHELSGGQRQRVALARSLAPKPLVVLMDEPFSNLDSHLREQIRDDVVQAVRASGTTCILVSHDQRDALAVSDRVAVMNQGRLEQLGTPKEIYKHPHSIFVATFVGRTNLLQGKIHGGQGCVLTEFGAFCKVDRLGLPEGTAALIAVRPEGFAITQEGGMPATVLSTIYTGSVVEAVVEVPTLAGGTRELTVHLPTHEKCSVGDRLGLRLVPDYASVVRNACEGLGFPTHGPPGLTEEPAAT